MKLWTDAIDHRGFFDSRYTCDVDNSSPELRWTDIPEGTAGYVLIAEERESPGFAHWVVYNIPRHVLHLPAGIPPQDALPNGIRQGLNGYGKLGYSGPCPPRGVTHPKDYVFRVYALRELPELPPRISRDDLVTRIKEFVLESAEVQGRYQRLIERAG